MSVQDVRELFEKANLEELILYSDTVSDTVERAAKLLCCEPKQIAKTMSFLVNGKAMQEIRKRSPAFFAQNEMVKRHPIHKS